MKHLLIDAIVGRGFPSLAQASRFAQTGLACFVGNRWDEAHAWTWDRERLAFLTEAQLANIYRELGGHMPGDGIHG